MDDGRHRSCGGSTRDSGTRRYERVCRTGRYAFASTWATTFGTTSIRRTFCHRLPNGWYQGTFNLGALQLFFSVGTTRIYLVGTSSVDARHQRCGFTSLLRPAIPRHPASPVGLLASAPDLVPGHEALPASLRKRFATTWISWGRGIDVNR